MNTLKISTLHICDIIVGLYNRLISLVKIEEMFWDLCESPVFHVQIMNTKVNLPQHLNIYTQPEISGTICITSNYV